MLQVLMNSAAWANKDTFLVGEHEEIPHPVRAALALQR